MKLLKGMGTALCLFVLCLVVAPKAKANEQPGNAVVTFAVPVEVPGVNAQTLPPGNYRFTVLESAPDRDIIQISSPDGSHVFSTLLGVPNSRLKAPDLITVVFTGRPAADPVALKAWYCPGRAWGDQIVYEKPRATQLAKETNEPVLSTAVVQTTSSQAVLKTALIEAVGPGGETVAIAQVVDAPPVVAPALAVAVPPAGAAKVGATEGSTVAATPAITVASTEAPTVVATPTVAATPAATIDPPATSATPATMDPAAASAPTPIGEPAPAVAVVPVVAVAPVEPAVTTAPVATAAPTVTAEPAVATSHEIATATLPKTASVLPLIGLVGLLMLGAGFLLTNLMKRRA